MQWSAPHGPEEKDKVFLNVEYADANAGSRGETIMWDLSASAATEDLLGVRVKRSTATANLSYIAGVLETDVPAQAAAGAGTAGARGRMCLVQCYGYHDAVLTSDGAGAAGASVLCSSGTAAGRCIADASVSTTAEVIGAFGFNAEAHGGGAIAIKAFIKAM